MTDAKLDQILQNQKEQTNQINNLSTKIGEVTVKLDFIDERGCKKVGDISSEIHKRVDGIDEKVNRHAGIIGVMMTFLSGALGFVGFKL